MMDNQQARQQVENANAALMFALPLADPMTNPPGRPIPTSGHSDGSDGTYERDLRIVNEQAREVEAPDDDERPVLFVRRRAWMGEVA